MQVQSAPSVTAPVSWPNHGPYQVVGDPGYGYGRMKIPVQVVQAVQQILHDDPAKWVIYQDKNYRGWGKWLVFIECADSPEQPSFLVEPRYWANLSSTRSVPFLNEVLGEVLKPTELRNLKKLEWYLYNVIALQKHSQFSFLTKKFPADSYPEKIDEWLQGPEKSAKVLRSLCYDPVLTRDKDRVTIRCNIMVPNGLVEQWTLRVRVDQAVTLEGIDIVELRKAGTFSYPPICG